jgi:hypothetical protein
MTKRIGTSLSIGIILRGYWQCQVECPDVGGIVTCQFSLSELEEAMAAVRQRHGLKVAVVPAQ